jgi:hypothetical protein
MDQKSLTLTEWCTTRKLSRSMFYKLRSQRKAPQLHYVGTKILISPAADAAWVAEREAEAAQAAQAAE